MELIIQLDEHSTLPLHRQLYQELRHAILAGRVVPGQRVPSTRATSRTLYPCSAAERGTFCSGSPSLR